MTAATASALALQQCNSNSATATVQQQQQQMFCSFLAISIEKQSRQTLQKVIKCVTACCWSCKFLHAGQKGRQLLPVAVDCCNLVQCCTRPSTASDMQLSTSIQLSTVTTERQRPRSPLNAAKITQSRGPNSQPTGQQVTACSSNSCNCNSNCNIWANYKSLLLNVGQSCEALLGDGCQAPPSDSGQSRHCLSLSPCFPAPLSGKCRGVKII